LELDEDRKYEDEDLQQHDEEPFEDYEYDIDSADESLNESEEEINPDMLAWLLNARDLSERIEERKLGVWINDTHPPEEELLKLGCGILAVGIFEFLVRESVASSVPPLVKNLDR
jgi:hypothetical protein